MTLHMQGILIQLTSFKLQVMPSDVLKLGSVLFLHLYMKQQFKNRFNVCYSQLRHIRVHVVAFVNSRKVHLKKVHLISL